MKERNDAKVRAKARARQNEEQQQKSGGGGGGERGETKSGDDGRHRLSDEGKRLFHSAVLTCPVCLSGDGNDEADGGENSFIKTLCGHHVHVRCAKSMIEKMWTGTRVTFNYLRCCACRAPLNHPLLNDVMAPHLAIKDDVSRLCMDYLKEQECANDESEGGKDEELHVGSKVVVADYGSAVITKVNKNGTYAVKYDKGGSFSSIHSSQLNKGKKEAAEMEESLRTGKGSKEAAMEESLQQVAAYQCDSCHLIYASGLAECGVAGGEDDDQPKAMLCPRCTFVQTHPSAKKCFVHGVLFAIFKCDCCCSIATYDCSGNHYCDTCHSTLNSGVSLRPKCRGQIDDHCPLSVPHPLNANRKHGGAERNGFVVGCTKCLGIDGACEMPSFGVMPQTKSRWGTKQEVEELEAPPVLSSKYHFCVDFSS